MHAICCWRCTGTMSGDDDLSTHYALAKLLSCPRRNSRRRRNSAPHLARFTATLAAHLARVTAILAAFASPLTSILTPFHTSGLRLRVRDHQHGRERGYCSRQAQRRKKLPSREHDCLPCWTAPRFKSLLALPVPVLIYVIRRLHSHPPSFDGRAVARASPRPRPRRRVGQHQTASMHHQSPPSGGQCVALARSRHRMTPGTASFVEMRGTARIEPGASTGSGSHPSPRHRHDARQDGSSHSITDRQSRTEKPDTKRKAACVATSGPSLGRKRP